MSAEHDVFPFTVTEVVIACKSRDRYFDLDAVRTPYSENTQNLYKHGPVSPGPKEAGAGGRYKKQMLTHAGAPPLDWWIADDTYTPDPPPEGLAPMTVKYHIGDVRTVLATMPENSVDLVMTSPPFLALRSYLPADHPDKALEIGSEATPGEFIDTLLDVVEACERVLAPHGSIVFELGDTYAGSGGAGGDYNGCPHSRTTYSERDGTLYCEKCQSWVLPGDRPGMRAGQPRFRQGYQAIGTDGPHGGPYQAPYGTAEAYTVRSKGGPDWPESKSLCLIPELFRIALVYGFNPLTGRETPRWRARNVVRWCRPNPPVGALGDKFRPATTDLVVACKARDRYFDLDAVREPSETTGGSTGRRLLPGDNRKFELGPMVNTGSHPAGAPPLDHWVIPTAPYKGAHYATYPPDLCVRPVKAMCPERVCTTCGKPSRRITEPSEAYAKQLGQWKWSPDGDGKSRKANPTNTMQEGGADRVTVGWTDCGHDSWRPGHTLDPFAGSGTTLAVAHGHGRDATGIDLDPRNAELAYGRLGMFLEVIDQREAVAEVPPTNPYPPGYARYADGYSGGRKGYRVKNDGVA